MYKRDVFIVSGADPEYTNNFSCNFMVNDAVLK